ncbi:kinase [Bacillus salitolerans]|uniref:Kinase n=1 Tax=Bacillus salitolerans TaxID=1437434 RepID=A0ABW4LX31_9BACI
MKETIQLALQSIPKLESGQRIILGIDGLSRSGKTTFVKKAQEYLQEKQVPVCLFHIDDYIVERKKRYNTQHEEWYEYYQLQWDIEWLKENFFMELKKSKELHLLTYDDHSDTQSVRTIPLPETCLLMIEGVFLQREEWRSFYDYMIYLDCPRDKRFQRESASTKQNLEKFENRYWKAEEYYVETVSPMEQADYVIQS